MLDSESDIQGFNTHWGNILLLDFLFSHSKAVDANSGIIAILVHFEKNSNNFFKFVKRITISLSDIKAALHAGTFTPQ